MSRWQPGSGMQLVLSLWTPTQSNMPFESAVAEQPGTSMMPPPRRASVHRPSEPCCSRKPCRCHHVRHKQKKKKASVWFRGNTGSPIRTKDTSGEDILRRDLPGPLLSSAGHLAGSFTAHCVTERTDSQDDCRAAAQGDPGAFGGEPGVRRHAASSGPRGNAYAPQRRAPYSSL